jgi:hypothetical protein
VRTCDQATTSAVAATDPLVISARPPWWSSHRPTGTAMAAQASSETVNAPVTATGPVRRSCCIGTSSTEKA